MERFLETVDRYGRVMEAEAEQKYLNLLEQQIAGELSTGLGVACGGACAGLVFAGKAWNLFTLGTLQCARLHQ